MASIGWHVLRIPKLSSPSYLALALSPESQSLESLVVHSERTVQLRLIKIDAQTKTASFTDRCLENHRNCNQHLDNDGEFRACGISITLMRYLEIGER